MPAALPGSFPAGIDAGNLNLAGFRPAGAALTLSGSGPGIPARGGDSAARKEVFPSGIVPGFHGSGCIWFGRNWVS